MKTLLIYYSHFGNTAFVASEFLEALKKKGLVDNFELEYRGGRKGLINRTFYRLFPSLVTISSVLVDLKDYDVLCLGIPVWGGRPSAPVTKYLDLCRNINDKKIICFFVYSIDASARSCFRYVKKILQRKGRPVIIDAYIPWDKVHNKEFLDSVINETIAKL